MDPVPYRREEKGAHPPSLYPPYVSTVKRAPKKKQRGPGGWFEAVYGKGEGVIECDAFSGDVIVSKK